MGGLRPDGDHSKARNSVICVVEGISFFVVSTRVLKLQTFF